VTGITNMTSITQAFNASNNFLQAQNDPHKVYDSLRKMLSEQSSSYFLCLASTGTSDIDGISAAGATPAQRRLTPSVDADILRFNSARTGERIPVSPDGIVSPVVIARACLSAMEQKTFVVDCGTFRQPLEVDFVAGQHPARCLSGGEALTIEQVETLFEEGFRLGKTIDLADYAIIAECVPGGTTTAAAVLQGLGVNCLELVSTSVMNPDKTMRGSLIESGIRNAHYTLEQMGNDPLKAIASVGDPMQAFVSGMTISVLSRRPVVLGGGSQMLAVYFLVKNLVALRHYKVDLNCLYVITTKWVVCDPAGNTRRLSELVGASFFASFPEFELSRFAGLRAYENGHVKEGLGAGALMAAAQARGRLTNAQMMQLIDCAYASLNLPTA
jgi:uncharacterized protein (TIGR00303 family)